MAAQVEQPLHINRPSMFDNAHPSLAPIRTTMKSLRLRYFLTHLAISAAVIGSCVGFVLLVWYPPPFAQLEGVLTILLIMAGVDIGAGPLCTLVAASPKKTRSHLARDLTAIGAVQLLALGYAMYTTCIARPAFVVYNVGQFEIEHANELKAEELAKASAPEFSSPPLTGPVFVEACFPQDPKEAMRIVTNAILTGFDIKDMPRYYTAWPYAKTDAGERAKPVAKLLEHSALRPAVMRLLQEKQVNVADAGVLPIFGRGKSGTVVLRTSDLSILGIIPLPFF